MSSGLRERKKAARRDELMAATRELVESHGLDHVTVSEVCDRVGVSERTFFNYFAAKEDAVLGIAIDSHESDGRWGEEFARGGPTGDLLADCGALVTEMIGLDQPDVGQLRCLLELVQREPKLLARHVAWLDARRTEVEARVRVREELRPTGVPPEVTSAVLAALVRASSELWLARDGRGSLADCVVEATEHLRRLVPHQALPSTPPESSPRAADTREASA